MEIQQLYTQYGRINISRNCKSQIVIVVRFSNRILMSLTFFAVDILTGLCHEEDVFLQIKGLQSRKRHKATKKYQFQKNCNWCS